MAVATALVLWSAATGARAGGGLPTEKDKPHRTRAASRRRGLPSPVLPATLAPVFLEGDVKTLRASEIAPKGCLFFATTPDISRVKGNVEKLAVWKILTDPIMAERFESAFEAMRDSALTSPRPGLLGFMEMAVAAELDYSPALSLFRKEIAVIGLPSRGGQGIRFAFVAAVGRNRDPIDDVLDNLTGDILTQYPQFTSLEKEHRGTQIRSLISPTLRVSFAYFFNFFIMATGKGTIPELINAYDGGRKKQLAGSAKFKEIERKIGRGADLFYRVDLAGLTASLAAQTELDTAAKYTRISPNIGTLWGTIRMDGEAVRERMEILGVPQDDGSLLRSIAGKKPLVSPPKTIAFFPVDTVLYYVTSIDPSAAIGRMRKAPRSSETISRLLATANKFLGFDLEKEVLRAFGGELGFGVIVPPGKPAEFLLVFDVRRMDLLPNATKAIDKFMERFPGATLKESNYRRRRIRYLEVTTKATQPGLLEMLLPDLAYALPKDGEPFLLASSRRALEKAIRQQEHGRSVLSEKPDFKRCTGRLRTRRSTLCYVDLKKGLDILSGQILTAAGPELPGPLAAYEELSAVVPHLFGLGGVVDSSRSRMSVEFHGPLGPVTAVGLSMVGSLGEGGAEPPIDADQKKLRRIGAAMHLYATDFDRFPTTLSELYNEYLQAMLAFESPNGRHAVKTKDDIDTKSDYVYVSGLSPMDLSDNVIVHNKEYVFGGRGRNVLFLDGRVAFIEESTFQDMMKRQLGERARQ